MPPRQDVSQEAERATMSIAVESRFKGSADVLNQCELDELELDPALDWVHDDSRDGEAPWSNVECTSEVEDRNKEFLFSSATLKQRVMAGLTDVAVIGFSCIPFIALMELNDVDLLDRQVQLIIGSVAMLVYFLYTFLLLAVAGRTVGMMAVNVIAVDQQSKNLLSLKQGFLRALGFLVGALPFFLGHLWPLVDREQRSLSDIISGTSIASAFEEYPQGRVPWLYRHTG